MTDMLVAIAVLGIVFPLSLWRRTERWFPIAAMIISTTASGYRLEIAGARVRYDYLVAMALFTAWAIRFARRPHRPSLRAAPLLFVAWVLLNLAVSLVLPPHPAASLRLVATYALMGLLFFVAMKEGERSPNLRVALWCLFITSIAASLYAVACRIAYTFGLVVGIRLEPYSQAPLTLGVAWEANILGSYAASVVMVALVLLSLRANTTRAMTWLLWAGLIVNTAGLYVALSRAPWASLAAGILLFLALSLLRRHGTGLRRLSLVVLVVTVAAGATALTVYTFDVSAPAQASMKVVKAGETGQVSSKVVKAGETGQASGKVVEAGAAGEPPAPGPERIMQRLKGAANIVGRFYTYEKAIRFWRRSPIVGNGANSFGQLSDIRGEWQSNLELRILTDTGITGLALFAALLVSILAAPAKIFWKRQLPREAASMVAFAWAGVVLLIAYQLTDASILGYFWVVLGLVLGASRGMRATSRHEDRLSAAPVENPPAMSEEPALRAFDCATPAHPSPALPSPSRGEGRECLPPRGRGTEREGHHPGLHNVENRKAVGPARPALEGEPDAHVERSDTLDEPWARAMFWASSRTLAWVVIGGGVRRIRHHLS
ncbi:MAG: O-antigen ligase family protein [Chloroflexi bacterium]|nr:O-antigen ligase family protein [Chloroflexota bacterium]